MRTRYFVGTTLGAVVATATVLLLETSHQKQPDDFRGMLFRIAARAPYRHLEGRLSGLPFTPLAHPRTPTDDLRMRGDVLSLFERAAGPVAPRDAALARQLIGENTEAQRLLENVVHAQPTDAGAWSDYAAVLHGEGVRTADFSLFARSLAAADRALAIEPQKAEARFNRAVALQALHLHQAALDAWKYYVSLDPRSSWTDEARIRILALSRTTPSQLTFKDLLRDIEQSASVPPSSFAALVTSYPRDARRHGESILLTAWAEAEVAGDRNNAQRSLDQSAEIGSVLARKSGEHFLLDVVTAIRSAPPANRPQIARALITYKKGRLAYAKWEIGAAKSALKDAAAAFQQLRLPMAIAARYYAACATADANEYDEALADLADLTHSLPTDYIALRAQAQWSQATILARMRRLGDAAAAYRQAAALFDVLAEHQDAVRMKLMLSHVLTLLGRAPEAWQMRAEAFRVGVETQSPDLLLYAISETAQQAMIEKEWDVAHSFYELTMSSPGTTTGQGIDARAQRALASWRAGFQNRARRELDDADRFLSSIAEPNMREAATHNVAFVRAIVTGDGDARRVLPGIRAAIVFDRERHNEYALPWMLDEEARLFAQLGDVSTAIRNRENALAIIDTSLLSITDTRLRDSYLGTVDDLYRNLISDYIATGRIRDAFATIERQRTEALLQQVARTPARLPFYSLESIAKTLPSDALLLHYTTLGDDVWLLTIGPAGRTSISRLSSGASALARKIGALHEAIESGADAAATSICRELYRAMIGTSSLQGVHRLIFVPDRTLSDVPFAALRADDGYLVERAEVVVAPSANVYVALAKRKALPLKSIFVVADPAFDGVKYPALPRLAGAASEGRSIARGYLAANLLMAQDARPARVLARWNHASVLHVATHALLDEHDPGNSALLLAGDSGAAGELPLHIIAAADLHRVQLVVLAGCRTATRANTTTNVSSLTSAFLAAGARNVIGSVWNIDDAATLVFSRGFHSRILAGIAPAAALRQTQIDMLHSSDDRLSRVAAWGGMSLYGPL